MPVISIKGKKENELFKRVGLFAKSAVLKASLAEIQLKIAISIEFRREGDLDLTHLQLFVWSVFPRLLVKIWSFTLLFYISEV